MKSAMQHEETPKPVELIQKMLRPFQHFVHTESNGGIVLLACTGIALAWANSPWAGSYFRLWEQPVVIGTAQFGLTESLHHWINDGLMAVFFFLVGLEIKRELLVGELASLRQAALPIAAAIGGMIIPAGIYAIVNARGLGAAGWGIPMATDIAFALGILTLLGPRVPGTLRVFLTALAIVDDLGAVLVIAMFYTVSLSWLYLGVAASVVALLLLVNMAHVRYVAVYLVLGVVLWIAMLKSGIHATVAGVLLAMTIPSRSHINQEEFLAKGQAALNDFQCTNTPGTRVLTNSAQQEAIEALKDTCDDAQTPLMRIVKALHGVVAFVIMPLFALANAGVRITSDQATTFFGPVTVGIFFGLVLGKPLGITLVSWLAVRMGAATLPTDVSWRMLHGVSWLGGIGFTMSLFIAGLAFAGSPLLDAAKIGILAASFGAGLLGWLFMRHQRASHV